MSEVLQAGIAPVPFIAGADYSASSNRYLFAALSGSSGSAKRKVVKGTGGSLPAPIGIFQSTACSGEEMPVQVIGFSKLVVDASTCIVAPGGWLTCASDGQGERVTSASAVAYATALELVSSGSAIIDVLLLPGGINVPAAS